MYVWVSRMISRITFYVYANRLLGNLVLLEEHKSLCELFFPYPNNAEVDPGGNLISLIVFCVPDKGILRISESWLKGMVQYNPAAHIENSHLHGFGS